MTPDELMICTLSISVGVIGVLLKAIHTQKKLIKRLKSHSSEAIRKRDIFYARYCEAQINLNTLRAHWTVRFTRGLRK